MSDALIALAFESTLKAWADAQTPPIPVAWENVAFVPPANGARYVRANLLPLPADSTCVDGTGRTRNGIFQVTLCMPVEKGAGGARTLVDSLDAAFGGVSITAGGLQVWLTKPFGAAPPLQKPERFEVPVSATYEAFAP
jgi:hypothetical protein